MTIFTLTIRDEDEDVVVEYKSAGESPYSPSLEVGEAVLRFLGEFFGFSVESMEDEHDGLSEEGLSDIIPQDREN